MSDNRIRLISISGPTASGKTAISVELAHIFDGEIVSSDSMQIYKGMDIATAKPSVEEQNNIPHYLIDFIDPDEIYSVARYVNDATAAIKHIHNKGKLPILVGGTGLYTDSLLNGIRFSDGETDLKLRKELQDELNIKGIDYMLEKLSRFDPQCASALSSQRNPKRIIRAMEVYYTNGVTITQQNLLSKKTPSVFSPIKIGINYKNRESLYNRINLRVDQMLKRGLLEEAEHFFSSPYGDTAKQAIGYKELKPFFNGEKTLDDCIDNLKQSTRRYAKRQLTWFKRDNEIKWFYPDDYENFDELLQCVSCYIRDKGFDFCENS